MGRKDGQKWVEDVKGGMVQRMQKRAASRSVRRWMGRGSVEMRGRRSRRWK